MRGSVLLIDDNAVQAATRQTILNRAGYHVVAALRAERALEQLQGGEFATPIGLVLTDHMMPGMNGSTFVRALRRTHPLLPVMVISGLEEAEEEYKGLDVTFRVKPLLPEKLLANVEELLNGRIYAAVETEASQVGATETGQGAATKTSHIVEAETSSLKVDGLRD